MVSKRHMKCHVLVDFDGTITDGDATDMLFGKFALPEWLEIEKDWQTGRIGSRECMARQVDLLRATPEAYDAAVDTVRVDAAFPEFVAICRRHGLDITVVSDGLDRTIERVLARHGLDLPFYANRLEHVGGDRWRLGFPHAKSDCRMLSGNCKCQFAEGRRGYATIMIGDGRSDFCVASRSDIVFAKGALARHCAAEGRQHTRIESFEDAVATLSEMLAAEHFAHHVSQA